MHPAAGLLDAASESGAFTVEINPEATPSSPRADLVLCGPAEDVLDRIEAALISPRAG